MGIYNFKDGDRMIKRILDLNTSDIGSMSKMDKLQSIKAAEGRTMVSEVITIAPPLIYNISNAELACAFGADMLILNFYDANNPQLNGLPVNEGTGVIKECKRLTGRFVGVNLEPVDMDTRIIDQREILPEGRLASVENVGKIIEQGGDMIVLTGNPKTGVTNEKIISSIKNISDKYGEEIIIMAGKMHSSGSENELGSKLITKEIVNQFIEAGADIILLPAPGTVPGMTVDYIREMVEHVHDLGKLTMTAVGTSQEGSDESTIRSIALYAKMTGTDMHHMGDSGISMGISTPENIMVYSIAIKGKSHTYRRMARSVNR